MRTLIGRAVLGAILVSFAPLTALAGENVFRFGAAYIEPAGMERISTSAQGDPPPISTTVFANSVMKVDGGASFTMSFERRFSDDLGLELNASHLETRVKVSRSMAEFRDSNGAFLGRSGPDSSRGDMTITPITLALNVYLDNRENVDVLLGPVIGLIQYDDVRIPDEPMTLTKATEPATDVELDDDFTYGLVFGIATPVGEKWEFRGTARWMKSAVDFVTMQQGQAVNLELDVDPVAYEFVFGVKF